jgi:hypothetical protein
MVKIRRFLAELNQSRYNTHTLFFVAPFYLRLFVDILRASSGRAQINS